MKSQRERNINKKGGQVEGKKLTTGLKEYSMLSLLPSFLPLVALAPIDASPQKEKKEKKYKRQRQTVNMVWYHGL